jgi:hypothetical protein
MLIFVMAKFGVVLEVRAKFLNVVHTSFCFKRLKCSRRQKRAAKQINRRVGLQCIHSPLSLVSSKNLLSQNKSDHTRLNRLHHLGISKSGGGTRYGLLPKRSTPHESNHVRSRLAGVVVSVLATGPKGRGFKAGRGDGYLRAMKIRSKTSFGSDGK